MYPVGQKQKGFTIVELLIVIVVIAIIAAISAVAYSGVTERAYNTRLINAARDWRQVIGAYNAVAGNTIVGDGDVTCLGSTSDYPATSDFAEGYCVGGWGRASDLVNEELARAGSVQGKWTQTMPMDNYWWEPTRGITFWQLNGEGWINYTLKGDVDCGISGAQEETLAIADPGVTTCSVPIDLWIE